MKIGLCTASLLSALLCPAPVLAEPNDSPLADAYGFEQLVILFPGDRTTVFDNDGEIAVQLLTLTTQHRARGRRIELLLNGRRVARGQTLVLRDVPPGMHRLRARIVAANGAVLVDSRPVRFFKWKPVESTQQASMARKESVP